MASLETTRGRQVPAWQQANHYYQQPTDYVAEMQPYSQSANTAPATRKRRNTNGGYTIQKGDTLSAIAKRYGTTVQAIAEANGIADVNKIYVGDSLNIPGNTTARTVQPRSEAMQRSKGRIDTAVAVSKVPRTLSINRTQPTTQAQEDNRIYRPQRQLPEVNVTARRNPTAKEVQERFHIPTYLPEVNIRSSRPGFSQQDMQAIRRSQQQNPPVVYNGRSKSSLRRYQRY